MKLKIRLLNKDEQAKTHLTDGLTTLAMVFALGQRTILGFNSWNPLDEFPAYTVGLLIFAFGLRLAVAITKYFVYKRLQQHLGKSN